MDQAQERCPVLKQIDPALTRIAARRPTLPLAHEFWKNTSRPAPCGAARHDRRRAACRHRVRRRRGYSRLLGETRGGRWRVESHRQEVVDPALLRTAVDREDTGGDCCWSSERGQCGALRDRVQTAMAEPHRQSSRGFSVLRFASASTRRPS